MHTIPVTHTPLAVILGAIVFSLAIPGAHAQTVGPLPTTVPGLEITSTFEDSFTSTTQTFDATHVIKNVTSRPISFFYKEGSTGSPIPATLGPNETLTVEITETVPIGVTFDVNVYLIPDNGIDEEELKRISRQIALIFKRLSRLGRSAPQNIFNKAAKRARNSIKSARSDLKSAPPTTACFASIRYMDRQLSKAEKRAQALAKLRNPSKRVKETKKIAKLIGKSSSRGCSL